VIGLDESPVAAYLTEGNLVAVGTDSLASCPSLDLLADVAALYDIARRQGYGAGDLASRLLRAATLGGAIALGMATGPDRVGQLQVGSLADLAFVDITGKSVREAIENLATDGAGRVAATMLGGEVRFASPQWLGRSDRTPVGA
jgi:cytosine/adenosine deaminase-related metal-dependent hydrolase